MQKLGVGGGPSSKLNCTSRTKNPLGAPGIAEPSSTNSHCEVVALPKATLCSPTSSTISREAPRRRTAKEAPVSREALEGEGRWTSGGRQEGKELPGEPNSKTKAQKKSKSDARQPGKDGGVSWARKGGREDREQGDHLSNSSTQGIPYLEA